VATRRQSPYVHKPAICQAAVTYLQFSIQVCFPCNDDAHHAHFRHRHISVTDTCGLSIDEFAEMSVCESATQRLSDVSITGSSSSSRSTSLVTRCSQADPITSPWQLFNINKCPRRRAHCSDQRLIRLTYLLCPRVCVRAGLENALSALHDIRRCHASDVSLYASARPASFHGMKTFSYTLSARRRKRNQIS